MDRCCGDCITQIFILPKLHSLLSTQLTPRFLQRQVRERGNDRIDGGLRLLLAAQQTLDVDVGGASVLADLGEHTQIPGATYVLGTQRTRFRTLALDLVRVEPGCDGLEHMLGLRVGGVVPQRDGAGSPSTGALAQHDDAVGYVDTWVDMWSAQTDETVSGRTGTRASLSVEREL
jgi:hypothetical protein